ncbi:hypothetical protein [Hymenobacter psoromatis]|uniref:hypothetical protein n=1 Tax=Hymenobacter psoromatis TaxID=1484116 RepID=UPI001CC0324E|nr:hypothetical protein [Hymenobacter psoromatis]
MQITEIDQEVTDYDWFAIDKQGSIGHFSSNGGILPNSISTSAEDLESVVDYFTSLKERTGHKLAPNFSYPQEIKGTEQKAKFLSSFANYSDCGLYSFDRIEPNYRRDLEKQDYSAITQPNKPLLITQVPESIQTILNRTVCNCDFSTNTVIKLGQVQNF